MQGFLHIVNEIYCMRHPIRKKIRKVMNSSGKAYCDLCSVQYLLQEHHIAGRDIPNPHHTTNIANLCPSCHFKVHHGILIIEKWMLTTEGRKLIWHAKEEQSRSGEDAKPYII